MDWDGLMKMDGRQERADLSDEDITDALRNELIGMSESVATIRKILFVAGLKNTDDYVAMSKKNAFGKEETLINPRVRWDERYQTPSFFWERTIRHVMPLSKRTVPSSTRSYEAYVPVIGSKVKQKRRVFLFSKHIPVNKRTQLTSISNFENEPLWAKTAAELIEAKLVLLRRRSKELSNINKQLIVLIKAVGGDDTGV